MITIAHVGLLIAAYAWGPFPGELIVSAIFVAAAAVCISIETKD
ncbi:hypothetical protein ACGYKD_11660 [Sulfitobacter sp. TB366]